MAESFDVIELTVDIPEHSLRAGMQGTIVHCHPNEAYEVEFTNETGETLDLLTLQFGQFIVIWRAKTKQWVPMAERIAALTANMPEEAAQEVLDFARFLYYVRRQQGVT